MSRGHHYRKPNLHKQICTFHGCYSGTHLVTLHYGYHLHYLKPHGHTDQRVCPPKNRRENFSISNPSSTTKNTLVDMNCNLHHPSGTHPHTATLTEKQTTSLASWRMRASACAQNVESQPSNTNTTIHLVWVSPVFLDWEISCRNNIGHRFSNISDHAEIYTAITPPTDLPEITRSIRSWKKLNPHQFGVNLAIRLAQILPVLQHHTLNQDTLDFHNSLVTEAMTDTMNSLARKYH